MAKRVVLTTPIPETKPPIVNKQGILKEDYSFRIEENTNYPPGEGNCFLMVRFMNKGETIDRCVGGCQRAPGAKLWTCTIAKEYDPISDSDSTMIGGAEYRDAAVEILWGFRHSAFIWGKDVSIY